MVDGCVSAISSDVQKEVTQKLIDESKHVKLEAERDTPASLHARRKNFVALNRERSGRVAKAPAAAAVGFGSSASRSAGEAAKKSQSESSKYIGHVFGKALLDQIRLEEVEERSGRVRRQLEEQREQRWVIE